MKFIVAIILCLILCGCASNTTKIEEETVTREDNFIREEVITEEDNKTLLEILKEAHNNTNEETHELIRDNDWDCSTFKILEIGKNNIEVTGEIADYNLLRLLIKFREDGEIYVYAIRSICSEHNIDIESIRLLESDVKYSGDYSYKGISLQSDDYYIKIAYSSIECRLCYEIKSKN